MKRCPECRRDYFDDSLLYCLEDGAELIQGSVPSPDEQQTAILSEPPSSAGGQVGSDAPTRAQIHMTDQTAVTPSGISELPKRGLDKRLIAAILLGIVVLGGFFGFRYLYSPNSKQIDSIAVMPFVNETGSPEIEYLSEGMTDTLINNLSQIPNLSVKARSSVFHYKGKEVKPQQIASDLNVQAIVNGRVTQIRENVIVNLELVNPHTGDQIWGEKYNRPMSDLVTLQTDIARDVSNKLRARLSGSDAQKVAKTYTANPEAYQLYLQGRYFWNKRNEADIRKSIDYFQKAIDKDPTYALAYAGLADAYTVLPSYTNDTGLDAYPRSRAAALKALELDDSLAEPHATLATVLFEYDWKFAEAEKEFKRAIELKPNYATAHHWYAEYLLSMGRSDEALAEAKRAQAEDPLSLIINGLLGIVHTVRGEHEQAIAQLKKTIELDPSFARAHMFLAEAYRDKGMFEEAIDEQEKHVTLLGLPPDVSAKMATELKDEFRRSGRKGYYRKQLEFIEAVKAGNPNIAPPQFMIALIYAELGENDKAFEYLERSYAQHEPDIVRLGERRGVPESLRSDPRFADLARRIGFPQ